jgi:hypothetical protein
MKHRSLLFKKHLFLGGHGRPSPPFWNQAVGEVQRQRFLGRARSSIGKAKINIKRRMGCRRLLIAASQVAGHIFARCVFKGHTAIPDFLLPN